MQFTFGKNWLRFSEILDERRILEAEANLRALIGRPSLRGLSFADIGAGSGLFSIAAARLGARSIVAFDRDEQCLQAIRRNARTFLTPAQTAGFDVRFGDVLRPDTLESTRADVVYAWGSLHHTGAMWRAIENASRLCEPDGQFVLAIYNRTLLSGFWVSVKRLYAATPSAVGVVMAAVLAGTRSAIRLLRGRHPLRTDRGMSVWYDAVDWLGGWPYECAAPEEMTRFVQALGFDLERTNVTRRSGCNEFAFRKRTVCAESQAS
jgi:2-polyprenyl-3-methyl-5-hydroxy-6-metoxy-1,4-benzoquinol methylase